MTNLARSGAPKRRSAVPIHGGMHARNRDGKLITGVTMTTLANLPDASGKAPLDPTVPGKRTAPVRFTPHMRSRTNEGRESHEQKIPNERRQGTWQQQSRFDTCRS